MSVGLYILRTTKSDEPAFVDAANDPVFLECFGMVKGHRRFAECSTELRGKLQQAAFSVACDKSPQGERYVIGLLPKCPKCGARKAASWHQVVPGRYWPVPGVTHKAWNSSALADKASQIDKVVQWAFTRESPKETATDPL